VRICFCTGNDSETNEFGLPVRYNWAAEYRGRAMVIYGHTPVAATDWLIARLTRHGLCFCGNLTDTRYRKKSLSCERSSDLCSAGQAVSPGFGDGRVLTSQQVHDDLLDIDDVIGKRSSQLASTTTSQCEKGMRSLH